eukprot:5532636-Pyramimonas_sp.AAC.1
MAAQYTPKMQSLFVDAVQIAHDLFQVNRDPFHGHPYSPTVLVAGVRRYDLDDPSLPRQPDGSIVRPPPSGGPGCPACVGNVSMHSPSHDRNPRHCRWCDKEDQEEQKHTDTINLRCPRKYWKIWELGGKTETQKILENMGNPFI